MLNLKAYFNKIFEIANYSDSREESYYSALEGLLKEYAGTVNKSNIHITTLPKKTEGGNPDFRIWDGKEHIIGYIETKSPTIENLDRIESSEQLTRYRKTFPNLILTNFFEFRLYRNGDLIDKVIISRAVYIELKTIPHIEKEFDFQKLLEQFFSFSMPKIYNAKTLAIELAKRTRFLRNEIISAELNESPQPPYRKGGQSGILKFYEAFLKYLINGLSKEEFADLYSQTITYGLFAARTRSENGFNRKLAYDNIPHTIGILRDVFKFISLGDLPKQMEWIIDDISEVLAVTDVKNILHQYFHEGKGKDSVVHFYETFLAEYDPQTREKRGVYYTPEPVVSYIVKSLNIILKEHFNKKDGFASNEVTLLDPAGGTLTFLAFATNLAVQEFVSKYGEGGKENFIKEHILKNFYSFEIMMAPYAVGHLKMSFLLEELGYKLQDEDRFKLYLTNTLEMEELAQTDVPGIASLSEESHLAGQVKKYQPILVILGNPPYSGISTDVSEKEIAFEKGNRYITYYEIKEDKVNGGYKLIRKTKAATREIKVKQKTWIGELIEEYKIIDGQWLKEKNSKWLQDDYVKFIRFAQWKIDQVGEGILGFITNHSYLDNPTFRGMRQSLMNSFNEIYILDLHGNSLKKEKCPDGSKDENVFDIQQGVAIALFIKKKPPHRGCSVYHSELWGLRENKYEWLLENDIKTTNWQQLSPKSEFYLFIPREEKLLKEYEKYYKITDIFPVNSVGIVTARDDFVIDFNKETLKSRIMMFRNKNMPDEFIKSAFNLKDKSNWNLRNARERLMKDEKWENSITRILYRPFDSRWIFNHDAIIERSRKEVMKHIIEENVGLISVRQVAEGVFNHAFVSNNIIESRVTLSNKGIDFVFPLYLYPDINLFNHHAIEKREPNINPKLIETLCKNYKITITPEKIFYYIYAVLYSNIYRTTYAEFLKIDFPRIQFTNDYNLFKNMVEYGNKLVDLHLLKSEDLDLPIAKFQCKGDNKVEKVKYEDNKIYINNNQYFENITQAIWEYHIGGYQVCEKWLKDRKTEKLSLEDIKHYCKIITALQKTIELQAIIDINWRGNV